MNRVSVLIQGLAVLALFSAALPAASDGETPAECRIGLSEYPGYAVRNKDGSLTGADVECAYRIAQYANLTVRIVLIPDAETYFNSLDDGSVDMLFDAIRTPEREKKYLYSEHESGHTQMSVYVRNNDDYFEYGNVEQLYGLTFGAEAGSYVSSLFVSWCKEHGFTPHVEEFPDAGAVNAALDRKEIDAGVYGVDAVEGYRTILQFESIPYYIIFQHDNFTLKNKVDEAMGKILSEDPLYSQTLIQKYVRPNTEITAFTHKEKEYIASHPVLKVAVLRTDTPYFTQKKNDVCRGVLPDYYARLIPLTGMQFVFCGYDTQEEAVDAVKKGRADIVGLYSDGIIAAYNSQLRLSRPYGTVGAVMVTRSGTAVSSIKKIAVKKRAHELVDSQFAQSLNMQLLDCENAAACFDAVRRKRADAMICGLPSAAWLINQSYSASYNSASIPYLSFDLCAAVAYSNTELCSILDKAVSATQYTFAGIVSTNTLAESSWKTFITRIPPVKLVILACCIIALMLVLVLALIVIIRRQREKADVAEVRAENIEKEAQISAMEKSTEVRNQFFSNISHDMRTPLNAIIGFSDLAEKTAVSSQTKEYLSKIQSSGRLLMNLIDDTLTLSKMNSGKLRLNPLPVYSTELYEPLVLPLKASAELKQISFTIEDASRPRTVLADKLNVQKILLNLLSNSVKYTPENGHVTLSMYDEPKNASDPDLVFVIRDDGIGISQEFLPHIYEPFIQENRGDNKSGGTGLGLSIVRNLVQMMGGTIEVQSTINRGTTFTVRIHLPVTDEKPESTENTAAAADLNGRKVLLCEDNDLNSEIACAMLQSKGVIVVTAVTGVQGVQLFTGSSGHEFDAVLMDLRMPEMNGFDAARAIRASQHPDAVTVPIIAMTADAFEDDAKRCFEAGMDAHITKPLDPEKLYRVLALLIKDSGGQKKGS